MILKKILKKKPEYPEYWAVVEVSDTAKDMFVKSDLCMVIKYFEGDKQVGQEAYSPHKVEMLTRRGIPVIYDDSIEGLEKPPIRVNFFGSWFFYRTLAKYLK